MGDLIRFRDDETHEEPSVTLDAFLDQPNATAVRLESTDDPRALIPHLGRVSLIEVAFLKFRDGRGFSTGSILREAGYTGELRAAGDILVDQINPLRLDWIDSLAGLRGKTVLDVGCGGGILAESMARRAAVSTRNQLLVRGDSTLSSV